MRKPFEREEKKGCTNLIFSVGAFNKVLKAYVEIKNGPKQFIVGNDQVERAATTIDPRKEQSGKHVDMWTCGHEDTKIEFKVNSEKILIPVYNSTIVNKSLRSKEGNMNGLWTNTQNPF